LALFYLSDKLVLRLSCNPDMFNQIFNRTNQT